LHCNLYPTQTQTQIKPNQLQSAAGAIAHHLSEQASGGTRRTPFENLSANAQAEVSNRLYEAVGARALGPHWVGVWVLVGASRG